MLAAEQIRFLAFGDRRVAYALSGDGPPLVAAAWWVSHLEFDWQDEAFRRFWEALAEGYTLVRYDRLGVGMSDREGADAQLTVDGEVALLRRVLDELELERVVLLGGSSGGCAAISFAARFPERVERLLLYGAYADGAAVGTPEVREAIVDDRAVALGAGVEAACRYLPWHRWQRRAGTFRAVSAGCRERGDGGQAA